MSFAWLRKSPADQPDEVWPFRHFHPKVLDRGEPCSKALCVPRLLQQLVGTPKVLLGIVLLIQQ